jgi:hypothetical protein
MSADDLQKLKNDIRAFNKSDAGEEPGNQLNRESKAKDGLAKIDVLLKRAEPFDEPDEELSELLEVLNATKETLISRGGKLPESGGGGWFKGGRRKTRSSRRRKSRKSKSRKNRRH